MKIFGYIRVSGASQVEKDGPVRQELAITEFCRINKLSEPAFFRDLGVSGTVEGLDRPGFIELIYEADRGDMVVVEKLERLARDLIVSEMLMRELRRRGISLFATDQGYTDLATADIDPSRKLIRQIFAAMAEYEKSTLVQKLKCARDRARKERQAKGIPEKTRAYGLNRPERITLELVINLRKSGVSWRNVCALLNRDKVPKRSGKREWTISEVYEAFAHRIPPD